MDLAVRSGVAGSDAERRAANELAAQLAAAGRRPELQQLLVRPRFGLTHALHCAVAVAGSAITAANTLAGTIVVALAAVSALLDVTGLLHLVRRLTGKRASQNVEAREDSRKPGLLVLTAGYDATRDSAAFARATKLVRDPWLVMLLAMAVLIPSCALGLVPIQFAATVVLIFLTPALIDIELQPAGGTTGDAEGLLQAANRLELEHFDVCVLLTGATAPFALGMRAWLRENRKSLDARATAVIEVVPGEPAYARRAGPLVPARCHRDLVRLCAEIAEDDGSGARSVISRVPGNAAAAIARGLPAIRVHAAPEFVAELARRLDREVGSSLGGELSPPNTP